MTDEANASCSGFVTFPRVEFSFAELVPAVVHGIREEGEELFFLFFCVLCLWCNFAEVDRDAFLWCSELFGECCDFDAFSARDRCSFWSRAFLEEGEDDCCDDDECGDGEEYLCEFSNGEFAFVRNRKMVSSLVVVVVHVKKTWSTCLPRMAKMRSASRMMRMMATSWNSISPRLCMK